MGNAINCKCGKPVRKDGQSSCRLCHNAYMRMWRKVHRLNPEQRKKMNCRCYSNVYKRRGKLIPQPCLICGDPNAEKHHANYRRPLDVDWLCKKCHLAHHSRHKRYGNQH
jgi:hypothetical protein